MVGDDLVDGVALNHAAAMETGDGAAAGKEQAEVVVDLGGRGDGGAWIAGLVFLFNGDRGGEAVHVVDVGLFDALEELPRVGGEGFDVAALTFGVDGVEGQRALAGAGDARDDGKGVVRDVDVDALEIVGAGAADGDLIGRGRVRQRGSVLFGQLCLEGHGHSLLSDRWAWIANGGRCGLGRQSLFAGMLELINDQNWSESRQGIPRSLLLACDASAPADPSWRRAYSTSPLPSKSRKSRAP